MTISNLTNTPDSQKIFPILRQSKLDAGDEEAYSQAGQRPAQCSGGRALRIAANSDGFDTDCSSVTVRLNQLRSGCE